jgi:hypothetical protein
VGAVRGWSRFAVVTLAVTVVSALLTIVAMAERLDVIARIGDPSNPTTLDQANASDAFVALAVMAGFLVFIATVVAFIGWVHSATKQVQRVRPELLRHSPGWAIGAWFVPFLNLVRPPQIVNDVRRLGAPDVLHERKVLVGWWWGLFLASRFAVWGFAYSGDPNTGEVNLDSLRSSAVASIVWSLVSIAAAVLAIAVVHTTTRRVDAGSTAAGWSSWQAYGYQPQPGYLAPGYPAPSYAPPGYAQPGYGYPPQPAPAATPFSYPEPPGPTLEPPAAPTPPA